MGWSSLRSVPTKAVEAELIFPLVIPGPVTEKEPCVAFPGMFRTEPMAMVPSWHARQSFEAPEGWPSSGELGLNVAASVWLS